MKRTFLLLAASLILIGACSSNKRIPPMEIATFCLFDTVTFEENISKAYYHPASKALYAMEETTHRILIWKGDKRINVIGGLGSGNTNFQSLSDFAMGSDGSIYALDAFAKVIKRFNGDGKFLNSIQLDYVQQPTKLALGTEQNVYVFDAASSEIVAYDLLDSSELYRFGRFQLQKVDQLFANRDYVVAYDEAQDKSTLFYSLGQQISDNTGQIVYDSYNNAISLSNEALVSTMSAAWLPLSGKAESMTIAKDILAIVVDRQVRLLKLDYVQVR
ncbi:MAG: 6-bladed beta-propeller [Candidatus Cloacimonetes bacterium]|jgi:hypothetical protein|nr:6-bladed beta-propeller [Candidatus Cloacimonadota bacterium]MCB5286813.1 6-bladed beta-propeller [Candidatus Cloacimonadota bacterium]MCK9184161.1 6-bladed beta-propeller [Candidatus Cloacimonadota bacterium]MCK9584193.1 6-bladed beta-propeller [Candidatus Cloacimonadota bacterium]MDY0229135.1 6-bladed beta-propeller [Candidatus Cloacimonadaceae bacterium]